jgi:hypothetical protein
MTYDEFEHIIDDTVDKVRDVLTYKGMEYKIGHDRLKHFTIASELMRTYRTNALTGMLCKHIVSIFDMATLPQDYPIELWDEKIIDAINYLILLRAIISEDICVAPK